MDGPVVPTILTVVAALKDVFESPGYGDRPKPKRVDLEYPEEHEDWPAVLVQFRPDSIQWTGVMPDEDLRDEDADGDLLDPSQPGILVRQGQMEGNIDLTILSLASEARWRIYDALVTLFLAGRLNAAMAPFWARVDSGELVGITVQEGTVLPIGDAVGIGTPWGDESVTYEASMRVRAEVTFYMDWATRQLLPAPEAAIYADIEGEPQYGEGDGQGAWVDA